MSQPYVFLPPAACIAAQPDLEVQWVADEASEALPFKDVHVRLGSTWTLVLPVEAVTCCAINLPTRKARWLHQALAFAVEQSLAEDVELMHLALGEQLDDGRHRVFATRRSWLSEWLALCPIPPSTIAVDADLLTGSGTALLEIQDRWLVGGEDVLRIALQAQDWSQVRLMCTQPHIVWCDSPQPALEPFDDNKVIADPFVWLAQQPVRNNLAQGAFAVQRSGGQWRGVKAVLGMAGMWLVLQLSFTAAQGWHLQRLADEYAGASAELYKELFPQDGKLVNLRAQFDQHMQDGAGAGHSGLLGLLAQVSSALTAEGVQVQIEQIDFSEMRGDLAMQVQAAGFAELERLRERLQESALTVQLGSANREGTGVSARVVVGK